ncbi:MAG: hypothetical protein H0V11_08125 [Actinobacteria bacterium]|nr:hypothetical protein [Actinomycetota bacterium]
MKRNVLCGLAAIVALGFISACSGGEEDRSAAEQATEERAQNQESATTTSAEQPSAECKRVPAALVAAIQEGITVRGAQLHNVYGVRSNDLEHAWYISGDLQGPGLDDNDDIATWAKSGDLKIGGGQLIASNAQARAFSDWGAEAQPGSPAAEAASMDNHGAQESQACVR